MTDGEIMDRTQGIGGTDISVVVGQNPYRSEVDMWLEKTGRLEPAFSPDAQERMRFGVLLEDVVAREFAGRTNRIVKPYPNIITHPATPIIMAHIDRFILQQDRSRIHIRKNGIITGADAVLECKTSGHKSDEWGDEGTDDVPPHYLLQCHWYMGITGLPVCYLAALFAGQHLEIFRVEHDHELFETLMERALEWWDRHIIHDEQPPPRTEADVKRLWRSSTSGKKYFIDMGGYAELVRIRQLNQQIAELKAEQQALRDRILPDVGDAEIIVYNGEDVATYKTSRGRKSIDYKRLLSDLNIPEDVVNRYAIESNQVRTLRFKGENK